MCPSSCSHKILQKILCAFETQHISPTKKCEGSSKHYLLLFEEFLCFMPELTPFVYYKFKFRTVTVSYVINGIIINIKSWHFMNVFQFNFNNCEFP